MTAVIAIASLAAAVGVSAVVGWGIMVAAGAAAERITGRPSASRALELERLRLEKEAEFELAVLRDRLERS